LETQEKYLKLVEKIPLLKKEIGKVIIGQQEVIDEVLISFLAGGHCLLEGVPGLAKTLLVKTLSEVLEVNFKRIQFTPDLMPGDILGTEILEEDHETGRKFFKFNKGPIFSNIVLADEINRTPPKTQAALLEAMQEYKVTYAGTNYEISKPFLIIATQNPIEQSGTYPLPEAQLDRFLLYIQLQYPGENEELDVLRTTTGADRATPNPVLNANDILDLQTLTRQVFIDDSLLKQVNKWVRSTRPKETHIEFVKNWCDWGAGPRAGQAMVLCAKARAVMHGRFAVIPEDLEKLAYPVLRHRITLNFRAEAEGIKPDDIIKMVIKQGN
jgi:MoxR-like ATPase